MSDSDKLLDLKISQNEISENSVAEFYKGRSILITGATGFMGKVLLEKLLRSCPDIKNIYIIVRPKKGLTPNTRVAEILKLPVFQLLRESDPDIFKKVIPVEGDTTKEDLSISLQNKQLIYDDVSVVFHNAATLKLEAELKESVQHNLRGTEYVLNFCQGIKNLKAFIHLSTAFCHCDYEVLEEKIYPPTQNPKQIMNICDWMDERSLKIITPSIIEPHPNTYTFTKRLSETIVDEYGQKMPVCILRPSIVLPTVQEPIKGWVDSLNGPVGVLVGAGKGVIRSMLVDPNNHAEVVPVDVAINAMIISAWIRSTRKFQTTPVYNITQSDIHPITWGEVLRKGRAIIKENPFDWPLWYPDGDIRTNQLVHNIIVFLFQVIPAYFMDLMFTIFMQKRFMVRIQKRIKLGMHLLQYFTLREWKIKNVEFLNIVKYVPKAEDDIFYTINVKHDEDSYIKNIILGARFYCLKESPKNIPFAKRYMMFLYILDRTCKAIIIFGFFYYLLKISTAVQLFHDNHYGLVRTG